MPQTYVMPTPYPRIYEVFPLIDFATKIAERTKRHAEIVSGKLVVTTSSGRTRITPKKGEFGTLRGSNSDLRQRIYEFGDRDIIRGILNGGMSYGEIRDEAIDLVGDDIVPLGHGIQDIVIKNIVIVEKAPDLSRYPVLNELGFDKVAAQYVSIGNPNKTMGSFGIHLTKSLDTVKAVSNRYLGIRVEHEMSKKFRSTLRSEYVAGVADDKIIGYTAFGEDGIGSLEIAMTGDRALNFDRDVACYHRFNLSENGLKMPVDVYKLRYHGGYVVGQQEGK